MFVCTFHDSCDWTDVTLAENPIRLLATRLPSKSSGGLTQSQSQEDWKHLSYFSFRCSDRRSYFPLVVSFHGVFVFCSCFLSQCCPCSWKKSSFLCQSFRWCLFGWECLLLHHRWLLVLEHKFSRMPTRVNPIHKGRGCCLDCPGQAVSLDEGNQLCELSWLLQSVIKLKCHVVFGWFDRL